ncbi:MAG: PAS domain S-box protein, partial [Candidatus Thorarchaeota archaeon]|nr:PAS domain S-box protein [Candidatus Thorarchaeota archaeon]
MVTKNREDAAAELTVKSLDDETHRWYILLTKIDYGDYRLSSEFLKALDLASPRRMVVGRDLKIQYVSAAMMDIDPEEFIGRSALEGVNVEFRDGLRDAIEAVFEEEDTGSIEISQTIPGEPTRGFVLRISPIRQQDIVIAVVVTSIDITERVYIERALQESEERFRGIFENAKDSIVLTDEKGNISAVNQSFEKYFGVNRNEIINKPYWEIPLLLMDGSKRSPEFQKNIELTISSFFETGDASWLDRITQGKFVHPITGSLLQFEQQSFRIPSSKGPILCSFIWDTTERNQIEEDRKRSEQLYRALFEQNNDAVFILDLEGNHIEANRQAAELLGYTIDELKKISIAETVIDREVEDSHSRISEMLNGTPLPIYERTLRKKNGDEITVEINVSLVRDDDGKPLHFQSIMRDITLRYEAEMTLRKDRRVFRELAHSFIQAKDINELTLSILERISDNYGFDLGIFTQYDPITSILQTTASVGNFKGSIHPDIDLSAEDSESHVIAQSFNSKTSIFVSDIEKEIAERPYLRRIQELGAKSVMVSPILDETDNVLAIVSFATYKPRVYTESDFQLFSTITGMLGNVLERRNAELQKQKAQDTIARERRAFQSIANAAVKSSETSDLAKEIIEDLMETLGFDFGTFRLYDAKEKILRPTAIVGMDTSKMYLDIPCSFDEPPKHLVSLVAITKEKIIAPDVNKHKSCLLIKERLETLNVKSIVVWPILNDLGDMIGIFSIGAYHYVDIPETTRPFFDAIAGMLNTIIERKKSEQALGISERRYR